MNDLPQVHANQWSLVHQPSGELCVYRLPAHGAEGWNPEQEWNLGSIAGSTPEIRAEALRLKLPRDVPQSVVDLFLAAVLRGPPRVTAERQQADSVRIYVELSYPARRAFWRRHALT